MKVLAERDDGIRVIRVENLADAEPWRAAFAGSYQAVWAEPPYDERWFPDEAEGILRHSLQLPENLSLLALRDSGVVAAFALSYPLISVPGVVREVRGLLPLESTYYFAELGVLEQYRGRGLSRQLIDLRLGLLNRQKYRSVLLRISTQKDHIYEMYIRMGFVDTGVYTEVASRRNDGIVRTDRRVYLSLTL
jgi:ribosomal protein S18 acetylase RimI-like enzyme